MSIYCNNFGIYVVIGTQSQAQPCAWGSQPASMLNEQSGNITVVHACQDLVDHGCIRQAVY